NIAVSQQAEPPQPHQVLYLGDQVAHRRLQAGGRGVYQRGVAQQAVVAKAQMLGGFQRAQVVQRAVFQRVQAAVGQVAVGVKQVFVVKKQAHSSSLLSWICWRSSSLARQSWLFTVA